jgi:hypothetical protein
MIRALVLVTLAAVPVAWTALSAAAPPPCPNAHQNEPLVVYTTAFGFFGPEFINLTVYNSGLAQISRATSDGAGSTAQVASLNAGEAQQLLLDLSALGAGQLCDAVPAVIDIPIQTLTVVRDSTDARTHTFSWRIGTAAHSAVQQRIQTFIHSAFPTF